MQPTGDGRVIQGAGGLLLGIHHLQLLYAPLLAFPPHDPGQGIHPGFIDIRHTELGRIQLVACAHGTDDPGAGFLGPQNQRQLGRHGVHRVHHVVIFLEGEFPDVVPQDKGVVYPHLGLGVDVVNPLRHHFGFLLADGLDGGQNLPVHVGQAHPVVVDQIQRPHPRPGQGFAYVSAHPADAENRHPGLGEPVHSVRPQQQPGSGKLILHECYPF